MSVGHNALHFSQKRAFAFPFAKKQPYRQCCHSGKTLALLATEHVYARRLVGAVGLEPTRPKSEDFKSPAYANSATLPRMDHRASSAVPNNSKKHPRARLTHETYPIVRRIALDRYHTASFSHDTTRSPCAATMNEERKISRQTPLAGNALRRVGEPVAL